MIDAVTIVTADLPTTSRRSFGQSHIASIIIGLHCRYRVIMVSIHLALNTSRGCQLVSIVRVSAVVH